MLRLYHLKKKKRCSRVKDYRPISILPSISKVFDLLIKKQISIYLVSKKLLHSLQSGFKKGHSTTTAMIKMVDDILSKID
jgi:hypothetical protein